MALKEAAGDTNISPEQPPPKKISPHKPTVLISLKSTQNIINIHHNAKVTELHKRQQITATNASPQSTKGHNG